MIIMINFPQWDEDPWLILSFSEFLLRAGEFSIAPEGIQVIGHFLGVSTKCWYLPPILVLWSDGSPDGDYVSQVVACYSNKV